MDCHPQDDSSVSDAMGCRRHQSPAPLSRQGSRAGATFLELTLWCGWTRKRKPRFKHCVPAPFAGDSGTRGQGSRHRSAAHCPRINACSTAYEVVSQGNCSAAQATVATILITRVKCRINPSKKLRPKIIDHSLEDGLLTINPIAKDNKHILCRRGCAP